MGGVISKREIDRMYRTLKAAETPRGIQPVTATVYRGGGRRWFTKAAAERAEARKIIQPWQFGHGETKATCLWLNGLMPLRPTNVVDGREARVHRMPPGPNRWKERSRTFEGIAAAMAEQWGGPTPSPTPEG